MPAYPLPTAPPAPHPDTHLAKLLGSYRARGEELNEANASLATCQENLELVTAAAERAVDQSKWYKERAEGTSAMTPDDEAAGPATAKPAAGFFENLFKSSQNAGRRTRKRRKNTKKRGGGAGASRVKLPPPRQLSHIPHVAPRCHSHAPSPQHTSSDLQTLEKQRKKSDIQKFQHYMKLEEQLKAIQTPVDTQRIPKDWDDLGVTFRPTNPADVAKAQALEIVRARQKEVQDFLNHPNSPAAIAGLPSSIKEGPNNVAKLMGRSRPSPKTSNGGARTRKRRRQRRTRKSRTKGNRKRSTKNKRRNTKNKRQSRR